MKRLAVLIVVLVVLVAGLLPACSSDDGERVVIYSGRTKELIGPLLDRFAKETGISVDVRYGDSADLALLIEQEGDRSPADVFLSQSPGPIGYLAAEGRLATLPASVLRKVDAEFESGKGLWVGLSGRVRVLVYNKDLVDVADLPTSVLDVTAPAYRNKVGVAPTNGSFQDFVTAMRISLGEETTLAFLRGLKDNGAKTYANNLAIIAAVGRGEISMGLVNHYYNFQVLAEEPGSPTVNHAFPTGDIGSLLIVSGVGVVGTSKHSKGAARLISFLLAEKAQRFFADETFEYPLAAGVEPADGVPPPASFGAHRIELDRLGQRLGETKALIERSGLERG